MTIPSYFFAIATIAAVAASSLAPANAAGFGPLRLPQQGGPTIKDCSDCPELVVVPAGSFTMGSPASEVGRDDDEGPQHPVTIPRALAVGKYDVTFAEWDACVADGGCGGYRPGDEPWGRGNRPVIEVSWDDAQAYVSWLSRKTGKPYRLLSESEWEYSARAGTTTPYYWGEGIGQNNANCVGCGSRWDGQQTSPVGSFPPNAFGLYDMMGNVWEWTGDCYNLSYDGAPGDGSAWAGGDCAKRVLRGGSWDEAPGSPRSADRASLSAGYRSPELGFRVARTY
jgi:formylglycine-generating enzyme required for sulfatase activity